MLLHQEKKPWSRRPLNHNWLQGSLKLKDMKLKSRQNNSWKLKYESIENNITEHLNKLKISEQT